MKRRQAFSTHPREHPDWENFWRALLHQHHQRGANNPSSSAAQRSKSSSSVNPSGTVVVTVPYSTATVDTTIWSTTVVTIHVGTRTPTATPSALDSESKASPVASSTTPSGRSDYPASDQPTSSAWMDVPPVVGPELEATLPAIVKPTGNLLASPTPTHNATESHLSEDETMPNSQKRAIVGGLSGTIAGLVLIGITIFFILRRRRLRRNAKEDIDETSSNEKGVRPELVKKWTSFVSVIPVGGCSPGQTQQEPPAVDEDHRIIRMSTRHWPRPFALGGGEGYRDSVAPGRLRVMNPDPSRPNTPRRSGDASKRASLAGSLSSFSRSGFRFGDLRTQPPSRNGPPSQQQQQQPFAYSAPVMTVVDPALSRECIVTYTAGSPSFRSYPSLISLPTIRQSPPEDPFLTPPDESETRLGESASAPPTRVGLRPSLASIQTATGDAASRTLNLLGNLLHPFRSQAAENLPSSQTQHASLTHRSLSSTLSSTFSSRPRSDPFDLDRSSIRGSRDPLGDRKSGGSHFTSTNCKVYEGT